jgi:hypothetical protein
MKRHNLAPKYRDQLSQGIKRFATKERREQYLLDIGLTTSFQKRIATEGALIGNILTHGFRMHCAIISDDAGQFNIFQHALCWIHAERKINELNPHGDACIKAVA